MNDIKCPVCNSQNLQDFWFWEKEDVLTRMWAMDTRVFYSICRDCSLIFQNPLVHSPSTEEFTFGSWDAGQTEPEIPPDEPIEWMRQFPKRGREPERALEIYNKTPRFLDKLKSEFWDIKAVSMQSLLTESGQSQQDIKDNDLEDGDEFDLIFCFDVLEKTDRPLEILNQLHGRLKPDGGIIVETSNPNVLPRVNQLCLTSEDACVFSFQSLIYTLYKAGFTNEQAEICGKNRCYCTKIDPNPDADASKLVPAAHWAHLSHRFQRNYYWSWTSGFLNRYLQQVQNNPDFLNQTRDLLRQRQEELTVIRDVCGAALLFVQEIDTVRQTISQDWSITMQRIFDILAKDYALFDLLQTGAPIPTLGTLPGIERFYFNDKMVYMTNKDYFERFFTQEDATHLCDGIIKSGEAVCKTLSSFL